MNEPEIANKVIQKSLAQIDPNIKNRIDIQFIFLRWREFAGDFADKISPVDIKGKTLVLYSDNSTLKDKFKYRAKDLILKINAIFGAEVIDKIIFGMNFNEKKKSADKSQITDKTKKVTKSANAKVTRAENSKAEKSRVEVPTVEVSSVEVTLTDDEISECEKKSAVIENPELMKMLFDCLVTKKKADKAKKLSDWHKCALCENLCPPAEILCDICQIYERRKLVDEVRRIFHDAPETKFRDVQKLIACKMPHMKEVCTLTFIESARMSLIQQTARRLSFGDTESDLAKFLVRLVRQLPEDELTEKIIEKTLYEFRFDFADRPPFKPQTFSKFNSPKKISQAKKVQQPKPPQTFKISPVIKLDSSDAKK